MQDTPPTSLPPYRAPAGKDTALAASNGHRTLRWFSMLLGLGLGGPAMASCLQILPTPPSDTHAIPGLMRHISLKHVAIGQAMQAFDYFIPVSFFWACNQGADSRWSMIPETPMALATGFGNVYQTGVPGVGIRFSFKHSAPFGWPEYRTPPFSETTTLASPVASAPNYMRVEYIRTAMAVGLGTATIDYRALYHYPPTLGPGTIRYIVPPSSVTITQNVYFSSCVTAHPVTRVPMDKQIASMIRQGQNPSRMFRFDVRCMGRPVAANRPAPEVRVYFQGTSPGPGLLALDDATTRARNVAIELKTGDGVLFPFSPDQAVPMQWGGSDGNGNAEIYGLTGWARYVPHGGAPATGSGNASLTYVLQYD